MLMALIKVLLFFNSQTLIRLSQFFSFCLWPGKYSVRRIDFWSCQNSAIAVLLVKLSEIGGYLTASKHISLLIWSPHPVSCLASRGGFCVVSASLSFRIRCQPCAGIMRSAPWEAWKYKSCLPSRTVVSRSCHHASVSSKWRLKSKYEVLVQERESFVSSRNVSWRKRLDVSLEN